MSIYEKECLRKFGTCHPHPGDKCHECGEDWSEHNNERCPEAVPHKTVLPSDPKERKDCPIGTGVLDYFPLAMAEIARVSKAGNAQHNPGQDLHWAKHKSTDHADCIIRHYMERGTRDRLDKQRHSAKLAWRALALLEMELEAEAAGMSVRSYIEKLKREAGEGPQPPEADPAPVATSRGLVTDFGYK